MRMASPPPTKQEWRCQAYNAGVTQHRSRVERVPRSCVPGYSVTDVNRGRNWHLDQRHLRRQLPISNRRGGESNGYKPTDG